MISRRFVVFMMLLMLTLIVAAIPEPIPLTVNDESREPAFICKEAVSYINCDPAINPSPAGDLVSFKQYLEQVLANEWHQNADFQAFKVGVIAVRTFADREIGCGAQLPYLYYNPLWPGLVYRMLSNESQAYWIIGSVPEQKQITGNHQNARVQTNGVRFDRGDNVIACAKHFTNTGNPTQSCTGNSSGQCPGGSNDQTTLQGAPDPVTSLNTLYPGMSQNGTAAWAKGNNPWDWRQIASHYYNKVLFSNNNSEYRWVWLDVGPDVVFTGYGGDEYYGPTFNAPDAMEMGQTSTFNIYIQNTSTEKWERFNSNRTRIGLYWNGNRNAATLWSLDEDMDPGEPDNVTVSISPPASGTHCLSVDMYRNGQWFSDQSFPTWPGLNQMYFCG